MTEQMSTTLLLIRHGETAWNAEQRMQGHIDIALNAEGERQAEALADALAGERIDAIVASDLQRARQTAQALGRRTDVAVRTDRALRERCYGAFEGLLYAEIAGRYPAQYAAWQGRDIDAVMPDAAPGAGGAYEGRAESHRAFYARTVGAILAHAHAHRGQTLALVAHGGVLECAYRAALGLPLGTPRDFPIKNASINRFTAAGGELTLTSWGEIGHLDVRVLDELV